METDIDGLLWHSDSELRMETAPSSVSGGKRTMDRLSLARQPASLDSLEAVGKVMGSMYKELLDPT